MFSLANGCLSTRGIRQTGGKILLLVCAECFSVPWNSGNPGMVWLGKDLKSHLGHFPVSQLWAGDKVGMGHSLDSMGWGGPFQPQ